MCEWMATVSGDCDIQTEDLSWCVSGWLQAVVFG